MKRLVILLAATLLPIFASAQAQINTKKVKISDFTQKTTMVVLSGNMFYDTALEDEIVARWKASPYGFCSVEEFEQLCAAASAAEGSLGKRSASLRARGVYRWL